MDFEGDSREQCRTSHLVRKGEDALLFEYGGDEERTLFYRARVRGLQSDRKGVRRSGREGVVKSEARQRRGRGHVTERRAECAIGAGGRADRKERVGGHFTLLFDHEYLHATSIFCLHATSIPPQFYLLVFLPDTSIYLVIYLPARQTILARLLSARGQINPPTAIPVAPTGQTLPTRRSARATFVSRSG